MRDTRIKRNRNAAELSLHGQSSIKRQLESVIKLPKWMHNPRVKANGKNKYEKESKRIKRGKI